MTVAKAELQTLNDNYRIEQAKLNNKRGTEVDLSMAYAEREAGEIAYYQSCVHIILWENMIESVIYVQS
jgi:selenocysteine-specific translation elongation factor